MKKTTKTKKAPAPATKLTAPAPARKTSAAPKIRAAAATPAAPAVVTKPRGLRVTLVAKADVGFGNSLFVRGDGAGLGWTKGIPLENSGTDTWSIILSGVEKPFSFKFVRNDAEWCTGEDFKAAPGETVTVIPLF
jgi:hypothetical protein